MKTRLFTSIIMTLMIIAMLAIGVFALASVNFQVGVTSYLMQKESMQPYQMVF